MLNRAIAEKFKVNFDDCLIDGGIQKYLDGYEISPHADIRRKAATFMVNINPSDKSEVSDHHTHYLKLTEQYAYVEEFWKGNENIDRAWVPWEWAKTVKQQTKNNSIVLFSPSNDTLHGVKASYDHLVTQRTQLYGNLWYKESYVDRTLEWEQLDFSGSAEIRKLSTKENIARFLPAGLKTMAKKIIRKDSGGTRNV